MHFTVNEVDGEQPISNWVIVKLAEFVRHKYGLDIEISFNLKVESSIVNDKPE